MLDPKPTTYQHEGRPDEHQPERLGELTDRRDVAPTTEWGSAHIAPTDQDTGHKVGMWPYTP